jgi:PadR family transcriptional regulator, regulatory protein PadR
MTAGSRADPEPPISDRCRFPVSPCVGRYHAMNGTMYGMAYQQNGRVDRAAIPRRVAHALSASLHCRSGHQGIEQVISSTIAAMMRRMVVPKNDSQFTQMRRGAIEYCVLAILREGERYGFELVRELTAADGLVTSEGTIYPLLSRLRREGLVETSWQESNQGPPRRYYRITKQGNTALESFVDQWIRFRSAVDGVLELGGIKSQRGGGRRGER